MCLELRVKLGKAWKDTIDTLLRVKSYLERSRGGSEDIDLGTQIRVIILLQFCQIRIQDCPRESAGSSSDLLNASSYLIPLDECSFG